MTKLTDLKEILKTIPEGKKITEPAILAVADLDFFRKSKPNTFQDEETVKIYFDGIFESILSSEKVVDSTQVGIELDNMFNGFSGILLASLKKEIDDKKFKNIDKVTIGVLEEDTSDYYDPSFFVKYFVFKIVYKPEVKMIKQTDKQVIAVIKNELYMLRKNLI